MATILGGDVTVTYLDANRQKRISWSGGATTTHTANALYSALMNLFDESTEMDDGIPMSAETPVEYTLGKIDSGDLDPWYITYETMEHITGGAIKTAGWTHVDGSAVGIVVVPVATGGDITSALDAGLTMTHTDTDTGTLLDVLVPVSGGTEYLIIRPDTNAAADSFDNTGTITSSRGAFTSTQNAAATTGEQIWANFYSVTPIEADTHVYLYQGTVSDATRARIASILDETQDWWGEGAFDRCIFIRNYKVASATIIDGGYVTALVRKGNTLYDSFELQASNTSGGRNPIPLSASADLNQTTGYKSITYTNASTTPGHWNVGDEILGGTSGARGIITQIDNPETATQTVHYYLIGDPQTDFNTAAETANNQDAGGTGSKNASAPANQGPALATWFTDGTGTAVPAVTFTSTPTDIDDDGTSEGYGIVIDCNQNPLTKVYEWLKYVTRNGEVTTTDTDGIEGEQYEGATVYLNYNTLTLTVAEGASVTQLVSLATGIVISHDTSNKQILLRNTRGTFDTTNDVRVDASNYVTMTGGTATTFAANKQAPFGSFAGGRFFGARGVVLTDYYISTDENSFQLTDSSGTARQRPQAYTITVTNLVGGTEDLTTSDKVAAFRLTGAGGSINKTEYSGTVQSAGATTVVVGEAITTNTPGKSAGGVLRIRDNSESNAEYRIRYSSWATSTFTLSNTNLTGLVTDATTTTTYIKDAAATFQTDGVLRGDLVRNVTAGAIGYVISVDSETELTTTLITGQTSGDTYDINTLPIATATADDVFVSLIDKHATTTTASTSIVTGGATIDYRVVVRNVGATIKIKPFTTDDAISTANRSVATIRTTDTIYL